MTDPRASGPQVADADREAVAELAADIAFLRARIDVRHDAGVRFGATRAAAIAACATAMADRFFAGATLLVTGAGTAASDARHNAVEYVHPALPGCRALPALAFALDDTAAATSLPAVACAADIVLAVCPGPTPTAVLAALRGARDLGMLTVLLHGGPDEPAAGADHALGTGTSDRLVSQELQLATYHMLWELVHIVLNHRGIAEDRR